MYIYADGPKVKMRALDPCLSYKIPPPIVPFGPCNVDRSLAISSLDLYLQISTSGSAKNNDRQALKCFWRFVATRESRLATHKGLTVGHESHPAFGVYLTN